MEPQVANGVRVELPLAAPTPFLAACGGFTLSVTGAVVR